MTARVNLAGGPTVDGQDSAASMRPLFLFLLVVVGAGAAVFYTNDKAREAIRGWQVSDEDRERFDAYTRGKALFKATWEGTPNGRFLAWGDDPSETAGPVKADKVNGDVWIARGHVTVNTRRLQRAAAVVPGI